MDRDAIVQAFVDAIMAPATPEERAAALVEQVKALIDANVDLEERVKQAFRLYRTANETANILTNQVKRLIAEKDRLEIEIVAHHARNARLRQVLAVHGLADEAEAIWFKQDTVSDSKSCEEGDAISKGAIPGELERDQSAHSRA